MAWLVDKVARLAVGSVVAVPDAIADRATWFRPTVDGQRLSPFLYLAMVVMKRELLAKTPPTAFSRRRMDWAMQLMDPATTRPITVTDIAIEGPAGALPARLYEPEGLSSPAGLVVQVHGGGWHVGSVAGYDPVARFYADKAGVKVLSVSYRLAPEDPFPAAFDDVVAGYRYAVDHAESLGVDPARIGIKGDSAGGNLAAAVGLHLGTDSRYRPIVVVLEYPCVDPELDRYESTDLFDIPLDRGCVARAAQWYTPDPARREDPRAWVMAAPDVTAMPPTYIATAGMDVLRDQGEAFGERLREAGNEVVVRRFPDLPHGFASLLMDPESRSAAEEIADFVGSRLG